MHSTAANAGLPTDPPVLQVEALHDVSAPDAALVYATEPACARLLCGPQLGSPQARRQRGQPHASRQRARPEASSNTRAQVWGALFSYFLLHESLSSTAWAGAAVILAAALVGQGGGEAVHPPWVEPLSDVFVPSARQAGASSLGGSGGAKGGGTA